MLRMLRTSVAWLLATAACFLPAAAGAREYTLDYQGALALAVERAPAVLAARARIAEAEGRKAGAGVRFRENPGIDLQVGPRLLDGDATIDFAIGLGQTFELGGRRGARLAAADAGIARERASTDDTQRVVLREVALAYYEALAAGARLTLTQAAEAVATDILAVTEQRLARGDLVQLDVNLARSAAARARSAVRAAEADREAALGALRALLALDAGDTIVVTGDLVARREHVLDELLASALGRPDLEILVADRAEAQAEIRLGDGYAWPDVRLGVSWSREENADLVLAGLTFTLPLFERGQEHRQVGRARAARATIEREGLARTIEAEVRAAFAVHEKRVAAVAEYEEHVLPLADENDTLLRKSFAAGQITLAEYLVARRELLDARREYLDRLFAVAQAAVELETSAGVLR